MIGDPWVELGSYVLVIGLAYLVGRLHRAQAENKEIEKWKQRGDQARVRARSLQQQLREARKGHQEPPDTVQTSFPSEESLDDRAMTNWWLREISTKLDAVIDVMPIDEQRVRDRAFHLHQTLEEDER